MAIGLRWSDDELKVRNRFLHYRRTERGAAAVELAFALFLLTIPILNVVDLAFYAFTWMQTQNAAQMGAQAAFSNCNTSNSLPAAKNCYGSNSANDMTLYDVVNEGIQESALNSTVVMSGNVVDGYYCSSNSSVLTQIGNLGYAYSDSFTTGGSPSYTSPDDGGAANCSGYADSSAAPGEYVKVTVSHSYTPIFPGMTVVSLLPATMTASAYVRIS